MEQEREEGKGINISELKGQQIKNALGIVRAIKRYHNKNKSGGNFGFTLIKGDRWFDLNGYHDLSGHVKGLRFGNFGAAGTPINPKSFDDLMSALKLWFEVLEI